MITNRYDFINLINTTKNILEIGVLDKPCININSSNYKVIDVFTTQELKDLYKNDPYVNIENIKNVDYINKNNDIYNKIIDIYFDYIVSSHNIEHSPCLISFLINLSSVLKSDGKIFLMIPDHRYCFDKYRNESTILDVLDISEMRLAADSI